MPRIDARLRNLMDSVMQAPPFASHDGTPSTHDRDWAVWLQEHDEADDEHDAATACHCCMPDGTTEIIDPASEQLDDDVDRRADDHAD